jgi:hypothetical protein
MIEKCSKGSEWRKWDLHVHTPASFNWRGTKKLIDMSPEEISIEISNFINTVNESDVAVFCLMDYWTFDWYLELQKYLIAHPDELKKTVLPGIELRIESPTDYRLNIHCILSNKLTRQNISDFKSELVIRSIGKKLSNESLKVFAQSLDPSKAKKHGFNDPAKLDETKLLELGSQTAEITKNSLEDAFKQIPKDSGYIILPYDTTDGLLKLNWEEHPHDDNYFMQTAHIFETRDKENVDLFSGIRTEINKDYFENFYKTLGGNPKPCVSGSDAHKYVEYGNFPSNKITWIKADPTFDGLSQILFEPTERVKISSTNPSLDFDKPYFSNIKFLKKVNVFKDERDLFFNQKEDIPLNQNLVTIIGGRGEGKSMLTDYLASSFIGQEHSKEGIFNKNGALSLSYHKSNQSEENIIDFSLTDDKKAVEFIYINQGHLKNIVEKKDKQFQLANSIRKLAKLKEPEFDKELGNEILNEINKFHKLHDFFDEKDDKNNFVNSIEYLEQQEKSINDFINNITTIENREKLEKYSENLSLRNSYHLKIKELLEVKTSIEESIKLINIEIQNVNSENDKLSLIEFVSLQKHFDEIEKWKSELELEIELITTTIDEVKEEFKDYKGDLTTLLNDIDKFQKNLTDIREKISISKAKKDELNKLDKKIFESDDSSICYIDKIKNEYNFKDVDSKEYLNLPQKEIMRDLLTDLEVEVKIDFDTDKFYQEIYNCIDGSKWRIKGNVNAQRNSFKITDLDSFYHFLKVNYKDFYNNDGIHGNVLKSLFFEESSRNKYLKVYPILKYKGKSLDKISVGQKGTVYLKMMLATEAFSKPIIFDQPEDDLDNEFIISNLISLFKELKLYRQVIIVTHNANLVVNADAEQVIVASNNDGNLSYVSGSLENSSINSKICKILEGGKRAFEKRRNKYQDIE